MFKRIIAGIAGAVMLTGLAVAGPFEDGVAAYARDDYATALRLWQPLAEEGNSDAQFTLGRMYSTGRGVSLDYAEAVKWFRLAADQGHAIAASLLGVMYTNGTGIAQDYVLAHMWFSLSAAWGHEEARTYRDNIAELMTPDQLAAAERLGTAMLAGPAAARQLDIMTFSETVSAYYLRGDYAGALRFLRSLADQGDARAQYNLGNLYADGNAVWQDYAEAARWYRMAADQGNAGAQDALGSMYEMGQGVPQDYVLAYMWWNLAGAQTGLPHIISQSVRESRDRVAAKMTLDQFAEAQRLAREWKPAQR